MADSSRPDEADALLRLSQSEVALLTAVAAETAYLGNLYDRETIYEAIVETAGRIFQPAATLLLLPPEPNQRYQIVACHGIEEFKGAKSIVALQLEMAFIYKRGEQLGRIHTMSPPFFADEYDIFAEHGIQQITFLLITNGDATPAVLWLCDQSADKEVKQQRRTALELFGRHASAALQRVEIFAQSQEQTQEMAVLSAIQHSLMSPMRPEEILQEIVHQIQFFLRVDSCSVFLYNEITNRLDLAISADPALIGQTITIPLDRGIAGRTMRTRRPVLVNDTAHDPEHQGALQGSALEIRAILCAPLLYQDETLGVIQALSSRVGAFTESHLNLLASAAAAAAIALQNARLHGRVVRRVAELDALSRAGWAVAGAGELNETLKAIVLGASRIPGVDWANVLLYDPQKEHFFQSISSQGPDGPSIFLRSSARGTGLSRQILSSGQPLLLNEIGDDGRISESVRQMGIQATIGVPVVVDKTPVGVLYANSLRPHVFDEGHVSVFTTLASQAAVAIQRARLVENIRHNEQQLQAILNSTADVVIATDRAGAISLFNPAAERMLGHQAAQVNGRSAAALFEEGPLAEALADDQANQPAVFELQLEDGRTLSASLTAVHDQENTLLGQVVTMHDISYLKELDRMKNEFVATVSHDLKNPIAAIQGFAHLLAKMGELNDSQRKSLQRIEDASQRMLNLVTDLLDLGRIEAGVALNKTSCNLATITEQTLSHLEPEASAKRISLATSIDPAVGIVGDAERLQQVVYNLIHNAIKYTPNDGQVRVTVGGNGDYAHLAVEDNGYGIPSADLPYIFDKFYRVPSHQAQGIEGTGLGLAIVKAIIEQHQGRVQVKSETGRGTTFLVELPYQL
jgi:PAS domain S-box-containing protein